jgi:hypothetical protein
MKGDSFSDVCGNFSHSEFHALLASHNFTFFSPFQPNNDAVNLPLFSFLATHNNLELVRNSRKTFSYRISLTPRMGFLFSQAKSKKEILILKPASGGKIYDFNSE